MSCFSEIEEFVQAHRPCGELSWWASLLTPQGYQVGIACPCGAVFDRWVTPQEADRDLLRSGLLAFPN